MKSVKAPPDVQHLVESLRDLGYEAQTAIADLIDNSIAADSTAINVEICSQNGSRPAHITISDNGAGMDRGELIDAMRFGVVRNRKFEELGKYGLGLKTASLSQCRCLTVISKPKSRQGKRSHLSIARWDLDNIYKKADWDLLTPDISELEEWERGIVASKLGEHGTVVIWSGLAQSLPMLSIVNDREREQNLVNLLIDVREHLSMVFHRFMQGIVPNKRKLKIIVCGNRAPSMGSFLPKRRHQRTSCFPSRCYGHKKKLRKADCLRSRSLHSFCLVIVSFHRIKQRRKQAGEIGISVRAFTFIVMTDCFKLVGGVTCVL